MSGLKSTVKKPVVPKKTGVPSKAPAVVTNATKANSIQPKERIIQNFLLIWLDSTIDESKDDCQKILKQLRSIINTIYTFTDSNSCVQFLNQINDEKVFMIASGVLGKSIMSNIHEKSQLDSVYIFCGNKTAHEQWIKPWSKIKGIYTQISSIFEHLQKAVKQCNQDSIPLSFVPSTSATTPDLDQLESSFMYTQIFKEILFELEYNEQSVQNLVDFCRERYKGNAHELSIINEFARDYRPESVIWWYTRECFTYQMLNRALRTLESDIIIKMGFFIRDLHRQIEKLHREQFSDNQNTLFTVYRGQCLSIEDFEKLKNSKGGLISFNNFLSTSKKHDVSLAFATFASFRTNCIGVLFKMNINPSNSTTPFGYIHQHSFIKSEEEVLFSMHSIFRIGEIEKVDNKNQLYHVILTWTNNNDRQLQNLTERIRQETNPDSKGWYRMGELLLKLGQFDKAEQLYSAILEGTPNDKERGDIYYQLGRIKYKQGDYEKAISFYEKELEIDEKSFTSNPIALAYTFNNIGTVYDSMKEYSTASSYYEKALAIYQKHLPPDHQDLAASYNNLGLLYNNKEEYSKALPFYLKSLEIKQKTLLSNHPLLGTAYNNIATLYFNVKEYSNALAFYEKALEIEQKTLPPNHPDLSTTYNNIAVAYEKMKDYPKALSFYERALAIKQSILPPDHPILQEIQEDINYIKKKL